MATDALGWDQIDIDPFLAGVLVLGFIYGAYFTETFRGGSCRCRAASSRPAAVRDDELAGVHADHVPADDALRAGHRNNWQVLVKSTALVSIIGLADVVKASQDAGKGTLRFFFFTLIAGPSTSRSRRSRTSY
uniref:GabY protein n=1 Tax=Burkholderia cepacia TaxID=292 RepID=Q51590_BURCE|nr:gabY [Burkholderia cepacia]